MTTDRPQPRECLLQDTNLTLTCIIEGFPAPSVAFFKDGVMISPGHDEVSDIHRDQVRINTRIPVLIINMGR